MEASITLSAANLHVSSEDGPRGRLRIQDTRAKKPSMLTYQTFFDLNTHDRSQEQVCACCRFALPPDIPQIMDNVLLGNAGSHSASAPVLWEIEYEDGRFIPQDLDVH